MKRCGSGFGWSCFVLLVLAGCGGGSSPSHGPDDNPDKNPSSGDGKGNGSAGEGGGSGGTGSGGSSSNTGSAGTDATDATCGNGKQEGREGCDDGNTKSGDGCDSKCEFESGWVCDADDPKSCHPQCGDGMTVGDEPCDDGNDVDDDYCSNACKNVGECGDRKIQAKAGEECDDGNAVTEDCKYGEHKCTVCTAECRKAPGATSYCGDSTVSGDEECDDGNAVTEACSYGQTSCTACNKSCKMGPGIASRCGDGKADAAHDEECDDGNTATEACDYGEMSCMVCDATCHSIAGTSSYCGDTHIDPDNGEQCDDGNTDANDGCDACQVIAVVSCGDGVIQAGNGEECDDHNTANLDGCNAACKREAGWTCPNVGQACVATCGDGMVVTTEACDDMNNVDTDYCSNDCHTKRSCGDGATQASAGEQCDDGNTTTETCNYGDASCTVCNASCKSVPGATSRCGDGVIDAAHGEECDTSGASTTCTAKCKLQKYCILDFVGASPTSGTVRIQGTPLGAGDGNYPQTGGAFRVRVPDVNGAPGDGPAAILYYMTPTKFMQTGLVTVDTDIVTTAGTPNNLCPLNTGTLTGTNLTFPACPYDNRTNHHCTNTWTPTDQNPPTITPTSGCLKVTAVGTIKCTGALCTLAGLMNGVTTNVNDTWYQPENTAIFNAAFTTAHNGKTGETTTCNDSNDTSTNPDDDYFEVPERVSGRTWIRSDGVRTSIQCGQLPATGCP